MPKVQGTGDVGGRDDDTERFALSVNFGVGAARFLPGVADSRSRFGVVKSVGDRH